MLDLRVQSNSPNGSQQVSLVAPPRLTIVVIVAPWANMFRPGRSLFRARSRWVPCLLDGSSAIIQATSQNVTGKGEYPAVE